MLKKLFASVSAFAVLFASVAPSLVTAAPVVTDPELLDAVTWAYDTGLTKYSDANTFMPFNNLTREQAAKFASEFAETVLNLEADSTRTTVCEYKDASIMDATLVDSVTKACQQSIMMGYQGNFMPKQLLTRGQFATMVSRMLGGIDAMSTEQAHFDYLNDLGIMNVASLTSTITRGDAMLMLYRVANGSSSDLCAIDPNLPGCSGTGPIVKQGDLNVALNPASPVNYSSIPQNGSAKFATVDFTAGSKDVTLFSVSLTRQGLGGYGDIDRVYFEKDWVRVSGKASVSSDNKVVLSFAPALVVTAGKTVSLDLYADMAAGEAGGEHQFVSTAINSSAANIIGAFVTPTLRTALYTVSTVSFDAQGAGNQYQIDGKLVELGQFKLAPTTNARDSMFKAITLTNSGRADLSYLSDIVIERNGNVVSSSVSVNGRYLTIAIKNDEILASQSALYTIKGIITNVDREGDSFQLYVRNTTDLNVVEKATSFRSQVVLTDAVMGNYSVKGADVRFATNSGFVSSIRAPQGATDVVLMNGTITSKVDVTLEDIKLIITPSITGSNITKRLTLTIGNSTFTHSVSGATAAYTGTFDGTAVIPAGQVLAVKLVADAVEYNAPADATLKVANLLPGSFTRIEYVESGDPVSSALGSILGGTLRVMPTNLQVSNTLSSSQTVVRGANNVAVLAPKFTTSYENSVRVNQFVVDISAGLVGTTWYLKDANGNVIANAVNNNGSVTFSNLNLNVTKVAPVSTTVVIDSIPSDNATGGLVLTITGSKVDAVDTSTWNTVTPNNLTKALTIADSATVDAVTSTNSTRLVYAGQTVSIGTLALKASKSEATITKLVVEMTGANLANFDVSKLNDVTLKVGTTSLGTAIISGNNMLVFDGLNYAIPAGSTKTLNVNATIPALDTVAELSGTSFGLIFANGTYTSANQELDIVGGQTMSSAIKVLKTKLMVSNPVKANGGLTPSMSFVLTPTAGNSVTVTGWSFLVSPNNVSGATSVVVSSEANGLGTIYASGTLSSLTDQNPLSISEATTVYVTIKTVTNWNVSGSSTPGNIVVSLTDFTYSDSVADGNVIYPNIYSSYVNDLGANISSTLTQ